MPETSLEGVNFQRQSASREQALRVQQENRRTDVQRISIEFLTEHRPQQFEIQYHYTWCRVLASVVVWIVNHEKVQLLFEVEDQESTDGEHEQYLNACQIHFRRF